MGEIEGITNQATSFLASLSFDVIVLVVLMSVFLLIGWFRSNRSLIGIIFSTYIAIVLWAYVPYIESIPYDLGLLFDKYELNGLILLLVIIALLHVVLDYALDFDYANKRLKRFVESIILAGGATLALLSSLYITKIATNLNSNSFLDSLFTNELYFFGILIVPLVALFFILR